MLKIANTNRFLNFVNKYGPYLITKAKNAAYWIPPKNLGWLGSKKVIIIICIEKTKIKYSFVDLEILENGNINHDNHIKVDHLVKRYKGIRKKSVFVEAALFLRKISGMGP